MLFSVLIYNNEDFSDALNRQEHDEMMSKHRAFQEHTGAARSFGAAVKLMSTGTAVTMNRENEEVLVTDGPFAETKEQFLGFYLIDYPSLDEAMEAVKILPIEYGRYEIRPVEFFKGADFKDGDHVVIDAS